MNSLKKILSVALSLSLLWTSGQLAEAAAGMAMPAPVQLIPPSHLGRVSDHFDAPGSSRIILIQDLHTNYGVQQNIAGLLEFLSKKMSFVLATEGASGPIDNRILALFPNAAVKEKTARYFMKEGELTGAEYFSIMHDFPAGVTGVENDSYYQIHRNLFRKTFHDRETLVHSLQLIQKDIHRLHHRTPEVVKVDQDLDLLLRLADLQATEEEVREFAPRLPQFIALSKALLADNRDTVDLATLRPLISSSIDYYVMALLRNEPMVENTLKLLNTSPELRVLSTKKAKLRTQHSVLSTAVLVAGGFHTASLTQILKKKNISYVVITPNVEEATDADHALYVKRLNGNLLTEDEILSSAPQIAQEAEQLTSSAHTSTSGAHALATGTKILPVIIISALLAVSAQSASLRKALRPLKQNLAAEMYLPGVSEGLQTVSQKVETPAAVALTPLISPSLPVPDIHMQIGRLKQDKALLDQLRVWAYATQSAIPHEKETRKEFDDHLQTLSASENPSTLDDAQKSAERLRALYFATLTDGQVQAAYDFFGLKKSLQDPLTKEAIWTAIAEKQAAVGQQAAKKSGKNLEIFWNNYITDYQKNIPFLWLTFYSQQTKQTTEMAIPSASKGVSPTYPSKGVSTGQGTVLVTLAAFIMAGGIFLAAHGIHGGNEMAQHLITFLHLHGSTLATASTTFASAIPFVKRTIPWKLSETTDVTFARGRANYDISHLEVIYQRKRKGQTTAELKGWYPEPGFDSLVRERSLATPEKPFSAAKEKKYLVANAMAQLLGYASLEHLLTIAGYDIPEVEFSHDLSYPTYNQIRKTLLTDIANLDLPEEKDPAALEAKVDFVFLSVLGFKPESILPDQRESLNHWQPRLDPFIGDRSQFETESLPSYFDKYKGRPLPAQTPVFEHSLTLDFSKASTSNRTKSMKNFKGFGWVRLETGADWDYSTMLVNFWVKEKVPYLQRYLYDETTHRYELIDDLPVNLTLLAPSVEKDAKATGFAARFAISIPAKHLSRHQMQSLRRDSEPTMILTLFADDTNNAGSIGIPESGRYIFHVELDDAAKKLSRAHVFYNETDKSLEQSALLFDPRYQPPVMKDHQPLETLLAQRSSISNTTAKHEEPITPVVLTPSKPLFVQSRKQKINLAYLDFMGVFNKNFPDETLREEIGKTFRDTFDPEKETKPQITAAIEALKNSGSQYYPEKVAAAMKKTAASQAPEGTTFLGAGFNPFVSLASSISKKPTDAYYHLDGSMRWVQMGKDIWQAFMHFVHRFHKTRQLVTKGIQAENNPTEGYSDTTMKSLTSDPKILSQAEEQRALLQKTFASQA